jgi:hypothetical protein
MNCYTGDEASARGPLVDRGCGSMNRRSFFVVAALWAYLDEIVSLVTIGKSGHDMEDGER